MKLSEDERRALMNYRFEKADHAITEAEDLAKLGHWSLVAQRLYYAAYYVASAKLLEKEVSAKSHAGVISLVNLHFVKEGTLTRDDAHTYMRLFEMRQSGDYDDYFDHTEQDVAPYIALTKDLIKKLKLQ